MRSTTVSSLDQDTWVDIADHPVAWRWLRELASRDVDGFLGLVGNNARSLRRCYGKPTWTANGQDGWSQGWSRFEQGMQWMILTGERGTVFRVKARTRQDFIDDPRLGTGITHVLQELLTHLVGGY